jgi:hypothetical protein
MKSTVTNQDSQLTTAMCLKFVYSLALLASQPATSHHQLYYITALDYHSNIGLNFLKTNSDSNDQ